MIMSLNFTLSQFAFKALQSMLLGIRVLKQVVFDCLP